MKISPLMQLLEDINFQRTKELRNLMKEGKKKKHFQIVDEIIDFFCLKHPQPLTFIFSTFIYP